MTYKIQIDDEVRDATPEEAALIDAQIAEAEAQEAERVAKVEARAALLERLGLSEDEARLLVGGA